MAVVVGLLAVVAIIAFLAGDDEVGSPPSTAEAPTTTATTTSTIPLVGRPGAEGLGDPYFPSLGNGGYDVEHYELDLTWRADEGILDGVATVTAMATDDLSRFNLDLAGMDVRAVTVDGEAAGVRRTERELVVSPARPLPTGERFVAVVTYSGRPAPISDGIDLVDLGWRTDGREAFVVSEPSGASTFFPVNDHPTDKASYTFRITAPEDLTVATNGRLVSSDDVGHGTRSWTYDASEPMASYLVQVAIGDLELVEAGRVGDVVVRHALHRSVLEAATRTVAGTADMLRLLVDVFGPYPFDVYGILVVDEDLGFALETQTLSIIGSDVATEGRDADNVLVHELAHQWVGNAVSPATWRDIWLNEGFATYAEWLYLERSGGPSAGSQARRYNGVAVLDLPPGDPGREDLFAPSVYLRGGMTLQALRERIGDDSFFRLLRSWVDEHQGGTASTDDFVRLAEKVSGQSLDDLFDSWVYDPVSPRL